MTPAKDAAASPLDSPAAESQSQSDAADDLVARLAGASISPAPAPSAAVAMSTSAAPSPLPSTPLMRSRGMGASASPAAAPPSPALEVRTRADARAFGTKVVDFETNVGIGYRASLVCNFVSREFTLMPQTPQAGTSKLVIPLCEVKTYTLAPSIHKITLTLNAAIAASPAARTALHDVLGKDLMFKFSTVKSYQEVVDELEKTLVFRQGTFEKDFELVHTASIGRGGNGAIFLVRRRGSPPDSIKFAEKRAHKLTTDLTREAEIHRLCIDCPYITKLVEFYDFNSGPGSQQHLIMELMEGGDLMHDVLLRRKEMYMDQGPGTLWMTDAEVRVVTWRVLKALQFMHSLSPDGSSVLHRDLKPDNIMLALRGPDGCGDCASAKVADLGHAKELVGVSQTYTSSGIGTVEYMPPEIAAAIVHKREIGHNKALDMWTVGVLVFVCFMQEYPFGGTGDENNPLRPYMMEAVRKRVLGEGLQGTGPEALHGLFPPGSPKAALWEQRNQHGRELMQRLMQREPAERWRVEDALSSPWFAGIEEEQGAGSEQ